GSTARAMSWSFREVPSTRHGSARTPGVIDFFAPPRDGRNRQRHRVLGRRTSSDDRGGNHHTAVPTSCSEGRVSAQRSAAAPKNLLGPLAGRACFIDLNLRRPPPAPLGLPRNIGAPVTCVIGRSLLCELLHPQTVGQHDGRIQMSKTTGTGLFAAIAAA